MVQVVAHGGPDPTSHDAGLGSGSAISRAAANLLSRSSLSIDQAQSVTLEKGQAVTDIDVVLAEGVPGIVNGVVTVANGHRRGIECLRQRAASDTESAMGFDGFSTGTGIRPDGTFRLVLAPGDYQLDARVSPRVMNGPTKPEDEQFGTAKVSVNSGSEDAVAITVGRGATATGRVVFEGATPPPPSPGKTRIPLFSETGECRSGEAIIAADWTFRIEGLSGTCSAPPFGMFGRWILKAMHHQWRTPRPRADHVLTWATIAETCR